MNKDIKKGLVPKLRFSEFEDFGEWEEKTVGQISRNVTAGGTPSTSEKSYWGGNIKWMNSGELNNKKVYEVQGRITEEGLRNSSTKFIPKHSVLIGLAGQGKTRGTVAMNMIEVCINQSIAAIFPNDEKFCSDFLYHNLDNRYDELRRLSAGGEGRGGLNLQIIKSLTIHLPNLPEQTKIAACLSSLDDLITAQTQKIEALKTHKKGLMQQLFPQEGETVPKLRFPEFRNSGEWNEKPLGKIAEIITAGGTPSTSEKSYWGGNIKWMNSGELNNKKVYEVQGRITEEGLRNSSTKFIPKHSVLIGLAGQGKTRGTVAMNMVEVCINQSIAAIFPNDEKFFSNFLYHNLDNRYDELRRLSAGGEGRGGLNLQIIKSLIIHLPKLKEQTKIANCLSSLDDLINAQVKKCELLKTHKKGLMQGLFPSSNEEDYTKSRQNLDTSETIEEISKKAMMLRNHDQ